MNELTVYFVRHTQTDDNVNEVLSGQFDTPLNQIGLEQAVQLREAFRDTNFAAIYCSDLVRSRCTAAIIHEVHDNVPIVMDARLREVNIGRMTKLSKKNGL